MLLVSFAGCCFLDILRRVLYNANLLFCRISTYTTLKKNSKKRVRIAGTERILELKAGRRTSTVRSVYLYSIGNETLFLYSVAIKIPRWEWTEFDGIERTIL